MKKALRVAVEVAGWIIYYVACIITFLGIDRVVKYVKTETIED